MKLFIDSHNKLVIALGIFMAAISLFAFSYLQQPISGDEPHYLVMTESIIRDHDLSLTNNYQSGSFREYYPYELAAQVVPGKTAVAHYSIHNPGLAFALVLPVVLGGFNGAIIMMLLLGGMLLYLLYKWVFSVTQQQNVSILSVALFAGTLSYLTMFGRIFPDVPIAILLLAGALLLGRANKSLWLYLALSLILSSLLWIHFKTLAFAGPMFLIAGYQILSGPKSERVKNVGALCLPLLFFGLLFETFLWRWYHVILPFQMYGQPTLIMPWQSLPALFFDSAKGLFIYNPIFLLLFAGLPLWWKQQRQSLWRVLLIITPGILALVTFKEWHAGHSPIARYSFEMIPLLIPALAYLLQQWHKTGVKVLVGVVVAAQFLVSCLYILLRTPWQFSGPESALLKILKQHTGISFNRFLPNYDAATQLVNHKAVVIVAAGLIAIGILIMYGQKLAMALPVKKQIK